MLWAWERVKTISGFGYASKTNLMSLINKIVLGEIVVWTRIFKNKDQYKDDKNIERIMDPLHGTVFAIGFVKGKVEE